MGRAAIQLGRLWNLKSINVIRERPSAEETEALKAELRDLGASKVVTEKDLMEQGFIEQGERVDCRWQGGG